MGEGDGIVFNQYLNFDGEILLLTDSYEIELKDMGGDSEAGTRQRDMVRIRVGAVTVAFSVFPV